MSQIVSLVQIWEANNLVGILTRVILSPGEFEHGEYVQFYSFQSMQFEFLLFVQAHSLPVIILTTIFFLHI